MMPANCSSTFSSRGSNTQFLLQHQCGELTDVIRSVTGRLEGVEQRCLLSKAKVGQLQRSIALLGGVQQVFRLPQPM